MLLARAIYDWFRSKHQYAVPAYRISMFKTVMYHVSKVCLSSTQVYEHAGYVSTTEGDSHEDTFVAGKNCVPLHYTDRSCDVQPYSDDYAPVKNVPIITAATGYTSATGMNYILVFPEALYMPSWSTVCSIQTNYDTLVPMYRITLIPTNPWVSVPRMVASQSACSPRGLISFSRPGHPHRQNWNIFLILYYALHTRGILELYDSQEARCSSRRRLR
jgi:hypothetical protein